MVRIYFKIKYKCVKIMSGNKVGEDFILRKRVCDVTWKKGRLLLSHVPNGDQSTNAVSYFPKLSSLIN